MKIKVISTIAIVAALFAAFACTTPSNVEEAKEKQKLEA
jgi:hypothetical protein